MKHLFNYLNPDDIPISPVWYDEMQQATEALQAWITLFEGQGYYYSDYGKISLDDLEDHCKVKAMPDTGKQPLLAICKLAGVLDTIRRSKPTASKGDIMQTMQANFAGVISEIDSAYPIDWMRAVQKHFNIRLIGDWAWAYGKDQFKHGTPLPCCQRSMLLLEIMHNQQSNLIYHWNYHDGYFLQA